MIVSGYLLKIPYWLVWQLKRLRGKLVDLVFYLDLEQDYYIIENILPHLSHPYRLAARNHHLAEKFKEKGIGVDVWPVFPKVLVMSRHAFHRFPISKITKIGLRHGPYHFKKMIASKKYNLFDLFLFTSQHEADVAKQLGINSAIAGGYPKLDAFRQKETIAFAKQLTEKSFFRKDKKTLLFTATWAQSGMSAVDKWIDQLPLLKKEYNLLVSLHPLMDKSYEEKVRNIDDIFFATPEVLPACMLAADFLVSDTSSVIAEFCALNKPIITFKVTQGHRLTPEITAMIRDVSLQIDSVEELVGAINDYESNTDLKKTERQKWNKLFYDDPDAIQGKRAANIINDKVKQ